MKKLNQMSLEKVKDKDNFNENYNPSDNFQSVYIIQEKLKLAYI